MSLLSSIRQYFQINPEDEVSPGVAQHFKHNFIVNSVENSVWLFGDSFVSAATILPVFAATITDSPLIIGLIPALLNAGWVLPQLFMTGFVQRLKRIMPFAKKMAMFERIPYLFFPLLALLLPRISRELAVLIFILLIAWRGFSSGLVSLPWQEVIARIIPISHRARFFGLARLLGQILGVIGSVIAALIFRSMDYPHTFALSFAIGLVLNWVSYIFFAMTIEPDFKNTREQQEVGLETAKASLIDFQAFKLILKSDKAFVSYLLSRSALFMGNMASGFLAVYAIQRFDLSDDQAAVFTGLLFLSGILGYALWGAIGDRIGPKRVLLVSGLLWTSAVVLAILSQSIWMFYGVFLLLGFANAGGILGELVMVMELGNDEQRPIYLGMARTLPGIFLLVAPLLAGILVKTGGYRLMFFFSLGFMAIALLFLLRVRDRARPKRRPRQD